MTQRDDVIGTLWHGRDPMRGFCRGLYAVDHQGWGSDHRYLARAIREVRPRLVVEIGVWKGLSLNTMAASAVELGLDCVLIGVDTWLGSSDHWMAKDLHGELRFVQGYPSLFQTFLANVFDRGHEHLIVPLPMDSMNAFALLSQRGMTPHVIHIDAGHDYRSVTNDLQAWWSLLAPGGILIGDDYHEEADIWPDVRRGFDDFFAGTPHAGFEHADGKCLVRKPA